MKLMIILTKSYIIFLDPTIVLETEYADAWFVSPNQFYSSALQYRAKIDEVQTIQAL